MKSGSRYIAGRNGICGKSDGRRTRDIIEVKVSIALCGKGRSLVQGFLERRCGYDETRAGFDAYMLWRIQVLQGSDDGPVLFSGCCRWLRRIAGDCSHGTLPD